MMATPGPIQCLKERFSSESSSVVIGPGNSGSIIGLIESAGSFSP